MVGSSAQATQGFDLRLATPERTGADVTLSLKGEIDLATAPRLERQLRSAERGRPRRITLDLAAVEFMDCSGLRVLLAAQERAERGHELLLIHVPYCVRRLLRLTGTDNRFALE